MSGITTASWWTTAGHRAAYTALAAATPLALLFVAQEVTAVYVLSAVAAAAFLSLVTSAAALPEAAGKRQALWRAILERSARTAGQVALPALAGVLVLSDIGWYELWVQVGGAVLVTVLRTLQARLPEAPTTPEPATAPHREGGPPMSKVISWEE